MTDIEAKVKTSISLSDNMELLWNLPISKVLHLDALVQNGTVIQKRKMVSTLFPDHLTFNGEKLVHTRVSAALSLLSKHGKSHITKTTTDREAYQAKSVHINRKHAVAVLRNRL